MKPIEIVGITALLAAIYDRSNLPSAIVIANDEYSAPFCLHSLREGPESTVDRLIQSACDSQGRDRDEDREEIRFKLYKFFEDFPKPNYKCCGCAHNSELGKAEGTHLIGDSNEACTKTTEMCA